ncbi:MAG: 50S ribosomal protein L29 [Candidatus Woesearchaeota archaeon]
MKKKELLQLDANALQAKLEEMQLELMKVNVQLSMGTDPKISGKIRMLRRAIARIKTRLQALRQ